MERRYGTFRADREIVMGGGYWPILEQLQFIPLKVELIAYSDRFEFTGYSPLFQEIPEGCIAPEYRIIIHGVGGGLEVKAERY